MKYILRGVFGVFMGFVMIAWVKDHVCILYSETNSLPYHYFLELKQVAPKKGQYTVLESPWYGSKVIKEIVGVAGDLIKYNDKGDLWVGDQLIGRPKDRSFDGRILTTIKPGIIPNDYVFLKGDHDRSFDSRYAELGLIHVKNLQGRVIGVW